MNTMIRKSILAVAIAAASTGVSAAPGPDLNFTFSGATPQLEIITGTFNNITLGGTTTIQSESDNDAVNLYGLAINGDLINNASINASGAFADGIDLDRSGEGSGPGVIIDGKFHNAGMINVAGYGSTGVITDSSTLGGGFLNSGTIKATGESPANDPTGVIGIEFSNSSVNGFTNTGVINVKGVNATGILSAPNDNDELTGAGFQDDIINSGIISATGDSADAISLTDTLVHGGIINSGTIEAIGASAEAIDLDGSSIRFIDNKSGGSIIGSGTGSSAILVDGAVFVAADKSGIFNEGTIKGGQNGILVSALSGTSQPLNIHQKAGRLEGGVNAINADGVTNVNLLWSGGTIVGNLLELNNVTVNGDGLLFEGDTIEAATINLASGSMTVTGTHSTFIGDVTLGDNTTLGLLIGDTSDRKIPILQVQGGLTVGNNSTIALEARAENFRAVATEYTVLNASNGISNAGNLTVIAASQLLTVKTFAVDENTVKAVVASKSDAAVIEAVSNAGGSSNAAAAAVPFANTVLGGLSENDPVFIAFANASTDAQLATLAEQLTPEVNGADSQAAKTGLSLVNGAIGSRSSAARTGLSSGDLLAETGVWAQALTSDATQDARKDVSGYDADSNGIAIGADGKLNEATTLGLAYSYIATDVNSGGGNKTEVTGNALTAYGNWTQGNWFIDGSTTYGWNDNESKRSIAGTQAKADYDSDFLGLNALAGYSYSINKNLIVEPQIGARYSNISIDSYTEKGSSAALSVGAQRYEIGEVGAGVRLAAAFDLGKGSLEPQAKVMAWHDFIGDEVSSTSTFVLGGTPFTTTGSGSVRDSYELGLGLDYKLDAWTVGGSYDYLSKTAFSADTFTAKVRYDF